MATEMGAHLKSIVWGANNLAARNVVLPSELADESQTHTLTRTGPRSEGAGVGSGVDSAN